jgi:excisionase family DNA binding protein
LTSHERWWLGDSMENRLLTYNDLNEWLQIPLPTLQSWVYRGLIPYIRCGKRSVRFDRAVISAWLVERTHMPDGALLDDAADALAGQVP